MNRLQSFLNDNQDILHKKPRSLFVIGLTVLCVIALPLTVSFIQQQQTLEEHAASTTTVSIVDFGFQPSNITIQTGDTVTWTNTSSTVSHTATSDTGVWDSGPIAPGQSYSFTFTTAGIYTYKCTFHPNMTGTITVVDVVSPSTTPTDTSTVSPNPSASPSASVSPNASPTPPQITATIQPSNTPTTTPLPSNTPVPPQQPTNPPTAPSSTPTASPTIKPTTTPTPTLKPLAVVVNSITPSPTQTSLLTSPTIQPTTSFITLPPVSLPPLFISPTSSPVLVANLQAKTTYILLSISGAGLALLLILFGWKRVKGFTHRGPVIIDYSANGNKNPQPSNSIPLPPPAPPFIDRPPLPENTPDEIKPLQKDVPEATG